MIPRYEHTYPVGGRDGDEFRVYGILGTIVGLSAPPADRQNLDFAVRSQHLRNV